MSDSYGYAECAGLSGAEPGYVYLAWDGRGFKIGKAKDSEKRITQHEGSNPNIKLLKDWLSLDYQKSETALKRYFKDRRRLIEGTTEWFHIEFDEVQLLVLMDDVMFNSWRLAGFPSIQDSESDFYFQPMIVRGLDGNDHLMKRYWVNPEPNIILEWAFSSQLNRRSVLENLASKRTEMLKTAVIRRPQTVMGETFLTIARAAGDWRTNGKLEEHFKSAFIYHVPAAGHQPSTPQPSTANAA